MKTLWQRVSGVKLYTEYTGWIGGEQKQLHSRDDVAEDDRQVWYHTGQFDALLDRLKDKLTTDVAKKGGHNNNAANKKIAKKRREAECHGKMSITRTTPHSLLHQKYPNQNS